MNTLSVEGLINSNRRIIGSEPEPASTDGMQVLRQWFSNDGKLTRYVLGIEDTSWNDPVIIDGKMYFISVDKQLEPKPVWMLWRDWGNWLQDEREPIIVGKKACDSQNEKEGFLLAFQNTNYPEIAMMAMVHRTPAEQRTWETTMGVTSQLLATIQLMPVRLNQQHYSISAYPGLAFHVRAREFGKKSLIPTIDAAENLFQIITDPFIRNHRDTYNNRTVYTTMTLASPQPLRRAHNTSELPAFAFTPSQLKALQVSEFARLGNALTTIGPTPPKPRVNFLQLIK